MQPVTRLIPWSRSVAEWIACNSQFVGFRNNRRSRKLMSGHWLLARSLAAVVAIGLAAFSAGPAKADIVMQPGGNFREVFASAFFEAFSENTTMHGDFDESVSASGEAGQTNATLNASAWQLSQFPNPIGEVISGFGFADHASSLSEPVGSIFAAFESQLTARFSVDEAEEYRLNSFVAWNGTLPPGNSSVINRTIVTLRDDTNQQLLVEVLRDSANQGSLTIEHQVLLQPGRNHTLMAQAETFGSVGSVASGSFSAAASWEIHLSPLPVLGDVNLDGVVNLLDVDPFIDRIITGDYQVEADTNQDGAVNLLDVDPFVALLTGK